MSWMRHPRHSDDILTSNFFFLIKTARMFLTKFVFFVVFVTMPRRGRNAQRGINLNQTNQTPTPIPSSSSNQTENQLFDRKKLRERLEHAIEFLNEYFNHTRDEMVRVILLAGCARQNILLLGPPGTGKKRQNDSFFFFFSSSILFSSILPRENMGEQNNNEYDI